MFRCLKVMRQPNEGGPSSTEYNFILGECGYCVRSWWKSVGKSTIKTHNFREKLRALYRVKSAGAQWIQDDDRRECRIKFVRAAADRDRIVGDERERENSRIEIKVSLNSKPVSHKQFSFFSSLRSLLIEVSTNDLSSLFSVEKL